MHSRKITSEFSIFSTKTRCSKHLSVRQQRAQFHIEIWSKSRVRFTRNSSTIGWFEWRSIFFPSDFAARQDNRKTKRNLHRIFFPHDTDAHRQHSAGVSSVTWAVTLLCRMREPEFSSGYIYSIYGQLNFMWELVCRVDGIFGSNFVGTHVRENDDMFEWIILLVDCLHLDNGNHISLSK